eukprot:COSAG01_NODE_44704_length_416_cov_1.082019_1_plen_37_part_10
MVEAAPLPLREDAVGLRRYPSTVAESAVLDGPVLGP